MKENKYLNLFTIMISKKSLMSKKNASLLFP